MSAPGSVATSIPREWAATGARDVIAPSASPTCSGEHCITCADEGVPMTVVRTDERRGLALCADAGGQWHTVETALVESPSAGGVVLVHAGVAIASLAAEAGRVSEVRA